MKPWIFLVVSSLLQVGWLVSLRETHGFTRIAPLAINAVFGFTSTVLLARSLEGIPMSTAYSVWTGVSIAGSVLADNWWKTGTGLARIACILLILAGAAGLRVVGTSSP
ncbi:MAG: DMT family transporter [Thermoanaerobaculia bacterium]